jgi:hypothetical protein
MGKILAPFLAIIMVAATAAAQTTPPSEGRAFDALSPGNQKIARALFEAQQAGTTTPLSLDEIAELKRDTGWGRVFQEMKSRGLLREKNLGQIVSRSHRPASERGTLITTASGRSHPAQGHEGSSANGRTFEDDHGPKPTGNHGRTSFESSRASGSGQSVYGGNKSAFGSGSGHSGKGGGRGKNW